MNNKLLWIIAISLLFVGIIKPNLNLENKEPIMVVNNLVEPTGVLKEKADSVIKALSVNNDRKTDGKRLASLYNDIATLISLDGDNQVIKNTEELRQSNRLVGPMLQLNLKGKYPDLPEAAQSLVVTAIGDDQVLLNNDLRAKAIAGFKALAWACNEGSK